MRNDINQHGVINLYIRHNERYKTGYSCQYKDPRFGLAKFKGIKQYRGLGSNIKTAIAKAVQLNALILPQIADQQVLDIVNPANLNVGIKLTDWLSQYTAIQLDKINKGMLKPSTWRTRKSIINTLDKNHGRLELNKITTKRIKELLDTYVSQGKARMAQSIRSLYIDVFVEAAQAGEINGNNNPASIVKNPTAKVTKSRLSLEQFNKITEHQNYLPHKCSYLLALVTAQRRTDLALLRRFKGDDWDDKYIAYRNNPNHFIDPKNDYGSFAGLVEHAPYSFIEKEHLHVFQLKTGKLLKIPMGLNLDKLGISIKDVVEMSLIEKDSPFVLQHKTARAKNKVGDPLHPDTISRSFKRARDDAKVEWNGTAATFHEIRSLAERLYREQGIDTRLLCGHSQQKMTDRYNDLRGSDWSEVKVKVNL